MAVKQTLRPIRASVAIERAYRKKLLALVDDMQRSLMWWIRAAYRRRESDIVGDSSPSRELEQEIRSLMTQWEKKYSQAAEDLARWFARKTSGHVTNSAREAIKAAGLVDLFSVKFQHRSREEQNMFSSIVAANVNLIKTIPQQHFSTVQTLVQNSIQAGHDLGQLTKELNSRYDITRRRAAMIARDQTAKASEGLSRARMQALGITKGIWIHTSAGKTYRESHVRMNGKEFDLSVGLYDSQEGRNVLPGECVNCFPGDSQIHGTPFVEKLFRRFYSGELTEIITDNGTILRVTPNHPVLTLEGWKRASLVNCGDYILQIARKSCYLRELNSNDAITTFNELFDALIGGGCSASVSRVAFSEFDGDVVNDDVDIVDINGFLPDILNAERRKRFTKLILPRPIMRGEPRAFTRERAVTPLFVRIFDASQGIMRSICDFVSIFGRSVFKPYDVGFATIPWGNSRANKAAANGTPCAVKMARDSQLAHPGLIHGNNSLIGKREPVFSASMGGDNKTSLPNIDGEVVGRDPQFLCDSFEHFAFRQSFNRVIDKRISIYSGHVYNLQTSLGWYIADYTIVHNCRCTYKPIITK